MGAAEAEDVEEGVDAGEAVNVGELVDDEVCFVVGVVPSAKGYSIFKSAALAVHTRCRCSEHSCGI